MIVISSVNWLSAVVSAPSSAASFVDSAVSSFASAAGAAVDSEAAPPHPVNAAAAMIVHISALKIFFFMSILLTV